MNKFRHTAKSALATVVLVAIAVAAIPDSAVANSIGNLR